MSKTFGQTADSSFKAQLPSSEKVKDDFQNKSHIISERKTNESIKLPTQLINAQTKNSDETQISAANKTVRLTNVESRDIDKKTILKEVVDDKEVDTASKATLAYPLSRSPSSRNYKNATTNKVKKHRSHSFDVESNYSQEEYVVMMDRRNSSPQYKPYEYRVMSKNSRLNPLKYSNTQKYDEGKSYNRRGQPYNVIHRWDDEDRFNEYDMDRYQYSEPEMSHPHIRRSSRTRKMYDRRRYYEADDVYDSMSDQFYEEEQPWLDPLEVDPNGSVNNSISPVGLEPPTQLGQGCYLKRAPVPGSGVTGVFEVELLSIVNLPIIKAGMFKDMYIFFTCLGFLKKNNIMVSIQTPGYAEFVDPETLTPLTVEGHSTVKRISSTDEDLLFADFKETISMPLSRVPPHIFINAYTSSRTVFRLNSLGDANLLSRVSLNVNEYTRGQYLSIPLECGNGTMNLKYDWRTVPGPPTNLEAISVAPDTIHLAWESPEYDGNTAIVGYRIDLKLHSVVLGTVDSQIMTYKSLIAENYITIPELASNSPYTFYVYSVNTVGVSTECCCLCTLAGGYLTERPSAPIVASISPRYDSLKLEWRKGKKESRDRTPVISYRLYMQKQGKISSEQWYSVGEVQVNDPAQSVFSAVITNIASGATYRFRVEAVRADGAIIQSERSEKVKLKKKIPSQSAMSKPSFL